MSLRKKFADSPRVQHGIASLFAGFTRFAHATSRWEVRGFEAMEEELARGEPVIFTVWHQRLMMAPYMFNQDLGKFCSLTSAARAGRMVGRTLGLFGFDTIPMSSHQRHVALSREVLRRMADGYTIGIAVDGPRGPARIASTVPLVWARSTGKKVFVLAWASRRCVIFPSWDRFMMPLPFTRGVLLCREWTEEVPRKMDEETTEALRQKLEAALDEITDEADIAAGRQPDPGKGLV